MTSEFDEAIRSATRDIIASAPPAGDAPTIDSGWQIAHSKARVMVAIGCLLIVTAGVAAVAFLAMTGDDESVSVSTTETSPPATDPVSSTATTAAEHVDGWSHTPPPGLRARCDNQTFDLAPGRSVFDDLPELDADALAALEFAESLNVPNAYERSLVDWRISPSDPDEVRLIGSIGAAAQVADPDRVTTLPFAATTVVRDGEGFRPTAPGVGGIGYCEMTIEADGWGPVEVTVDRSIASPASNSIPLIITERACASGRTPPPEDLYIDIDETDTAINVLVLMRTPDGDQTCTMNPSLPIDLPLTDPLNDRVILNQGTVPAVPLPSTTSETGFIVGNLAMEGGPEPGTTIAIPGTISIRRDGIGEVLTITSDDSGMFVGQVPPGDYRVSATSPNYNDGQGTCNTSDTTLVVTAGQPTYITVTCPMR